MSAEEQERLAVDRFLPSLLRYDDLSKYVVEEVAEVASVVEAGEVEGETTRHSRGGDVSASPADMSGGPSGVVFAGCLSVASRSCQ